MNEGTTLDTFYTFFDLEKVENVRVMQGITFFHLQEPGSKRVLFMVLLDLTFLYFHGFRGGLNL